MEKPNYGRSGLLVNPRRDGVPVTRTRLLRLGGGEGGTNSSTTSSAGPVPLKWYPTLLTLPSLLLQRLREPDGGRGLGRSLGRYLRASLLHDMLCRLGVPGSADAAGLTLEWFSRLPPEEQEGPAAPLLLDTTPPLLKMVVMRDGDLLATHRVCGSSVTLFGKDASVCDVVLAHPSCSAQHAAVQLQFGFLEDEELLESAGSALRAEGTDAPTCATALPLILRALADIERRGSDGGPRVMWEVQLMLTDLGSTNGTFVGGERLAAGQRVMLIEGDVVSFGASTRQYVLVKG